MSKISFRRDALLALCTLVLSLGTLFCLSFLKKDGAYAVVIVDGKEHARHALSQSTAVEIATEHGRNTLKIENGKASIISADCPDGLCASHAPVSRAGEAIVCLPNKLVVEIRDE